MLSNLCYVEILKKIYYILIKDAITQRKRIMRCLLWDWAFTLTLHVCSPEEQDKLINKTISEEIRKKLDIID